MSNRLNINVYNNPPVKTKYFPAFDGVDFSSPYTSISEKHSPKMINMYRDYSENGGGRLRTRPFTELVDVAMFPYYEGQYPISYNKKLFIRSAVSLKDYSAKQFIKNNIVFTRNAQITYTVKKNVTGDFNYYFEHMGGRGKLIIKDVDGSEKTVFTFGNDSEYKAFTGKWMMMGGATATFIFTGDVTDGDETYKIRNLVVNDKDVKDIPPATIYDMFENNQPSDKMHIEYGNKLYFYEKNSDNMGDVYVYDGTNINRFSNMLLTYKSAFESNVFYYTGTITFPYTDSTQTKRYKPSDYTLADAMLAFKFVIGKLTTLTPQQKNKYDIGADGFVKIDDSSKIFQIVAGKYQETIHYFTQDDLDDVLNILRKITNNKYVPTDDELKKYDVNHDDEITSTDLEAIRAYVSKGSYDIKSIPVEIAPVIYINANSSGAGAAYERINLLSPYFINQFVSDGTSTSYKLSIETAIPIKWQSEKSDKASAFAEKQATPGSLKFSSETNKPAEKEKFYVLCKMSNSEYEKNSKIIADMSIAQIFDNRVFLAGNPNCPNRIIYSNIDNLLYFPENSFYEDIMGSGEITALLPVKTQLAVIKSDKNGEAAIYLHTPTATNNELAPKTYPSAYGMFERGCVNKDCYANFNGESVFLSKDGLMAISSTNLSEERSLSPRSTAINGLLCKNDLSKARMIVWQNYLVIAVGTKMFLADANKRVHYTETQAYEYEWFYWENLGIGHKYESGYVYGGEISSLLAIDNILYYTLKDDANIVTVKLDSTLWDDRFYRDFTACGEGETEVFLPVYSYIATPYTSFGHPQYYKSCMRHGNSANITGTDIKVYANTDVSLFPNVIKNTNYNNNSLPYFIFDKTMAPIDYSEKNDVLIMRPSLRKWLNLSLVFYSEKPMIFYDATIQAQIKNTVNDI